MISNFTLEHNEKLAIILIAKREMIETGGLNVMRCGEELNQRLQLYFIS